MTAPPFKYPKRVILVVTALSEERRSVLPFLAQNSIRGRADAFGREFITGDYYSSSKAVPWHIVLPPPTSAGNAKAAAETALSLALSPSYTFLLGVAGGFPDKVNMYDVVVADRVYDVDSAKIDENDSYIPRPDQHKATSILLSRAKTLQDLGGWQSLLHPQTPNHDVEVWVEPIAAGSKLVASSKSEEFKRIQRDAPRAVAVENEGFGVMQAAHEANAAALVIRGISDLIDNRLFLDSDLPDAQQSEGAQRIRPDAAKIKAARHAAAFMFALIGRLSPEEAAEAAVEAEEYVYIKLRWKDLKDLTQGRCLALQIIDQSLVRDFSVRQGSVEVEFRSSKLIAAFLYALSIHKNLLSHIVDITPDTVDTLIDTANPDVSRVFDAVSNLSSPDPNDRQIGENKMKALVEDHPSLLSLSNKVITASRAAHESKDLPPKISLQKDARITIAAPVAVEDFIYDLSQDNQKSMPEVAVILLKSSLELIKDHNIDLEPFEVPSDSIKGRINTVISKDTYNDLQVLAIETGFLTVENLIPVLLAYGIEMRVSNLFDRLERKIHDHVTLDGAKISSLINKFGVVISSITNEAQVDTATMRRAMADRPIRRESATAIIRALAKYTAQPLHLSEYIIN